MNQSSKLVKEKFSLLTFLWGLGFSHPAVESDLFSVRWRGQIEPRYSETYTFTTKAG